MQIHPKSSQQWWLAVVTESYICRLQNNPAAAGAPFWSPPVCTSQQTDGRSWHRSHCQSHKPNKDKHEEKVMFPDVHWEDTLLLKAHSLFGRTAVPPMWSSR